MAPGELGDTPRFRLLSDEKLRRIHEASLELLEDVGVRIATEESRELLADAGCTVTDGEIVKIPCRVVEDAIDSAPKRVVIYDREGNEALILQGKNTHFGMGVAGLYFIDPETAERRNALVEDIGLACRVADALPNIDFVATPLVTRATPESPQEIVNQREFEAMVSNTTKPLFVLVENATSLEDILDMASAVAGGAEAMREKPFVVPYLNNVSPLVYNAETLDKILLSVDRGIPVRCIPSPLAGGTVPVTLAGTVAVANAESLCGLVISQVRRRGAPHIIGFASSILDMKTANITYSSPEGSILSMAAAELGHYYDLPVAGSGCFCSSMGADQQAALEQMMSAYSCMMAGLHLVSQIGGMEAGLSFSLEAAVMGDEIIGMLRRIMRGLPVNDEALALDTIRAVGPGGNFLETEHTFRHYKREQWQPTLLCRTTYASWVEMGEKLMGDRVKEKLAEIIRTHQPRPLPDEIKAQMSATIQRRKRSPS